MTFNSFLRKVDATLQSQYSLEKFKDGKTGKGSTTNEPNVLEVAKESKPRFKRRVRLDLPGAYEEKKSSEYLNRRQVQGDFYYAKTFRRFINGIKHTFDDIRYDEERIIIPLYYNGDIVGVQGRALASNPVKYITVMFDDDAPKIYGLDKIRTGAPVFVVEGPFDSTFIRNSIAMCGADADVSRWGISDPIWVYDNEPRSKEITSRIERTISSGAKVVIWPTHLPEKDINDMVLAGHDVQSMVESNVYSGLKATLQFNTWKRI